ncbi:MAG: hypothetical protein HY200_08485 [Nitrospirae bacterium]|nr:hypothetical protein [Nitrospirota bacterium]
MILLNKRLKIKTTVSTPSWWKMVLNKIRRTYLCYFDPEYVKVNEAARVGECFGCGKCCTLVFKCVFLQGSEEQARCQIYDIGRPKPCGAFPIDPRDLADVNFLCGYSFVTPQPGGTTAAPSPSPVLVPVLEPAYTLIRKIEPAGSSQTPLIQANLISE